MFEFPLDLTGMVAKNPPPTFEEVNLDISNNPALSKDVFYETIKNIEQVPDYQLANVIRESLDVITNDVINKYDSSYITIFTNEKFLECFLRVVSSLGNISYNLRLCCNKLAYDYLTYNKNHESVSIKSLFVSISKIVNRDDVNKLMSIGLDSTTATNMALARRSSSKEVVNVNRLNFVICNTNPEAMTEQMIIFIYEKLFDRVSDLFESVMFEVYTDEEEDEIFGDDFMSVYSNISLVILAILNNMTSEQIRQVLTSYVKDYEYRGRPRVRFSLRAISSDYSRITNVISLMDSCNMMVP